MSKLLDLIAVPRILLRQRDEIKQLRKELEGYGPKTKACDKACGAASRATTDSTSRPVRASGSNLRGRRHPGRSPLIDGPRVSSVTDDVEDIVEGCRTIAKRSSDK